MTEEIFMKFGMYITAPESISAANFTNPSHQSVSICVSPFVAKQRLGKNPLIVVRQRLGKNVTAETNTHATIEEFFDASFSMRSVSYQGK
jgi:hypothetical protein